MKTFSAEEVARKHVEMRALLSDIYNHLFRYGYPYKRSKLEADMARVLDIPDDRRGEVWRNKFKNKYA